MALAFLKPQNAISILIAQMGLMNVFVVSCVSNPNKIFNPFATSLRIELQNNFLFQLVSAILPAVCTTNPIQVPDFVNAR